jgi:hypothetical protein
MRAALVFACLVLATLASCSPHQTTTPGNPPPKEQASSWPADWSAHLGQTVTLEGTAGNAKEGALLEGEKQTIWIDGLEAWPEGFYGADGKGKRLRVRGTVIRRDDVPVFVQRPGEPPQAGIAVGSEEEAEKARWRFLLKGATWVEVP